ncbi:mitochondral 37S ribosomal protein S27 [Diaporthe eres]
MSVPRERLLQLLQTRCRIFATTYNPDGVRMGNKILRQRLRGPALAAYYPRRMVDLKDLTKEFGPALEFVDEDEDDRQESLAFLKARGKGAPKKKKGPPGQSSQLQVKKTSN